MTLAEQEAVSQALGQLAETLDAPLSEMRLAGYLAALDDLEAKAVVAVLAGLLRTATFFPKPVEIRTAVAGGSTDDAAVLAWGNLLQDIRRIGRYGKPSLALPPATYQAMLATFGSWNACCDMAIDGPERQGYAKQFRAVYGAAARRDEADGIRQITTGEARTILADLNSRARLAKDARS